MEKYTRPEDIQFIVVDLFAGAGGTSTGVERAYINGKKVAVVIAAVNHNPIALANHELNHPHAYHFIEDVRTLDMSELVPLVNAARRLYKNAKLVLWASAECTFFSQARSGPKDEGSRSLPEALYRYIDAIHPHYVFVENVKEFLDWGPCNENMYPIKEKKGEYYKVWRDEIMKRGYEYTYEVSSAAEVGAYTDRVRYFGAFRMPGMPFAFPVKTHSKDGSNGLKRFKPVRDVLDLEDHGTDIFEKQKSDNTYRRVYIGLEKYTPVSETFLAQYNGASGSHNVDKPCGTLTTKDRFAKVDVQFMDKQYGTGVPAPLDIPAAAITTVPKLGVVTAQFMDNQYGMSTPKSLDAPAPTITANPKQNLVTAQFMDANYGNSKPRPIEEPIGALTTKPKHSVVTTQFMDNPQWGGNCWSIDRPCFTLVARMDKAPPSLVSAMHQYRPDVEFRDDDTPYQRKIKEFMIVNNISKIYMRMLNIKEMLRIMGFGDDYQLTGTITEQKKGIGNAVVCDYSQAWFEAMGEVMLDFEPQFKIKFAS